MRVRYFFKYFWQGFQPESFVGMFPFLGIHDLVTSEDEADVVFVGCHGADTITPLSAEAYREGLLLEFKPFQKLPSKIYVYVTWENVIPDPQAVDFSISQLPDSDTNLFLPMWAAALMYNRFAIPILKSPQREIADDVVPTISASFLYSHKVIRRERFARLMSEIMPLAAPGKSICNVLYRVPHGTPHTIEFYSKHIFNISFENSMGRGYTTEKLWLPLISGAIPIYWGDPDAAKYFNPECFIHVSDFNDWSSCLDYISDVMSSPARINAYRSSPCLTELGASVIDSDRIEAFFKSIFDKVS